MKDLNSIITIDVFSFEGLVPTKVNLSSNIYKFLFLCKLKFY